MTGDQTQEMPWYWQEPAVAQTIFSVLCKIAFGRPTLHHQWDVLIGKPEVFKEDKNRIAEMVKTWIVVGSLLLATTAALVTTPPPAPQIIDYTQRGVYHCLWTSFGLMLGGILAGSFIVVSLTSSSQDYVRWTLMSTRLRIWTLLILMSYPFITITSAAGLNMFGLLIAGWTSEDVLAKIICSLLLALPISICALKIFTIKENTDEARGDVRPRKPAEERIQSSMSQKPQRDEESGGRLDGEGDALLRHMDHAHNADSGRERNRSDEARSEISRDSKGKRRGTDTGESDSGTQI